MFVMQQQVATVEQASCAQCWRSPTRGEPPLIRLLHKLRVSCSYIYCGVAIVL